VRRHARAFGLLVLTAVAACSRAPGAEVLEHHGRWESGYGAEWYNVVGRLKNVSGHPLAYVKLRIDALDASGKTVASSDAYNESAEALTVQVEDIPGVAAGALQKPTVKPLAPDAEERFRGSFLKDETPPFTDYHVTIVETPPATN
jgi:hypothetical protein